MRNRCMLILTLATTFAAVGCYERVVSERPFPGMTARRTETAQDYSEANAQNQDLLQQKSTKPFDPIGDLIIRPIGGAAQAIGNAFSGPAEPDPKAVQPTTRPVTSASDLPPPPPAKE